MTMAGQWKLVSIDTGQSINVGDEPVTGRGERVRLTGLAPPHKPEASGKVFVEHQTNGHCDSVYYASVVGARYVRE
jgi:S-adenosylmethionine synthetase